MSEDHTEEVISELAKNSEELSDPENFDVADPADELLTPDEEVIDGLCVKINEQGDAIEFCIAILDPNSTGHVPTGSPAKLQQILEVLNKAVEA